MKTWHKQHEETDPKLKDSLRQLNDKIEEAKRKRNLLVAKQKRAQAQKRIHETMSGLNDKSAFETFERMAEKIEESERRTLASAEVTQALTAGDQLEQEFAKLKPANENVEFRLLQLKERMGILAPGSEQRPALTGGNQTVDAETVAADEDGVVHEGELEEET